MTCRIATGSNTGDYRAEGQLMSFGIYLIGYLIVIGGLIYGATLLHVPTQWIVVGAIVLAGVALVTGVRSTRQKDSN
jgi:hypothetical protein